MFKFFVFLNTVIVGPEYTAIFALKFEVTVIYFFAVTCKKFAEKYYKKMKNKEWSL